MEETEMSKGLVISLCDLTGNMVRPWAENGYECICYDLQHSIRNDRVERFSKGGEITFRWANVRQLTAEDFPEVPKIVFAFPPCTHLSVSGARDFQKKGLRLFIEALEIVESCRMICEWFLSPYMIENPVSRLSSAWREPDYYFHPHEYGDGYTKKTCLWTGGGFIMPPKLPKSEQKITMESYIHKLPPSEERANLRSATPMGFAKAVYEANKNNV
jgi:hypothetical protein